MSSHSSHNETPGSDIQHQELGTQRPLPQCNSCNDVTHVTAPATDPPICNLQPATCNGESPPLSNSQTPQLPNSPGNSCNDATHVTAPATDPPTCNFQPATCNGSANPSITPKPRSRNGLVARLPKPIRDRINVFLDDGLSYSRIVKTLATDAPQLTPRAVMSWKHGGYQDYLHHQQLLDECRARTERAFNMLRGQNPVGAFQATQQIATAQICEAVADMGGDVLRQALAANPLNYFRMLNSFARLTNGGLRCERHLIDDIILRAKISEPGDGQGGMSEKAVKEMEDGLQLL